LDVGVDTEADETLWQWIDHTPLEERNAVARRVYGAEDFMVEVWGSWDDEITEADVPAFASGALSESGWDRVVPSFVFDLAVEPGKHAGRSENGIIHLVPEHSGRLGRMLVLHELTHHIAPGAGHGPLFCRILADLVSDQLGTEVAVELLERFDAHGAVVADRPMGDPYN
jgi:hypothetical protein